MQGPRSILSIGYDPTTLAYRHMSLTRAGYCVTSAIKPERALGLLSARKFDLVVCCLSGHAGTEWLEQLRNEHPVPIIFMCCDNGNHYRGEHISLCSQSATDKLLERVGEIFSQQFRNQA